MSDTYTEAEALALLQKLQAQLSTSTIQAAMRSMAKDAKVAEAEAKREHDAELLTQEFSDVIEHLVAAVPVSEAKSGHSVYQAFGGIEVSVDGVAYTVSLSIRNTQASAELSARTKAAEAAKASESTEAPAEVAA